MNNLGVCFLLLLLFKKYFFRKDYDIVVSLTEATYFVCLNLFFIEEYRIKHVTII